MTHVVTGACVDCKYTDCVEVCPVDCFYEGENFLVIDPIGCIDCGVCIPECPIDAIVLEGDNTVEDLDFWTELNATLAEKWADKVITEKQDPMDSATDDAVHEGKKEKVIQ